MFSWRGTIGSAGNGSCRGFRRIRCLVLGGAEAHVSVCSSFCGPILLFAIYVAVQYMLGKPSELGKNMPTILRFSLMSLFAVRESTMKYSFVPADVAGEAEIIKHQKNDHFDEVQKQTGRCEESRPLHQHLQRCSLGQQHLKKLASRRFAVGADRHLAQLLQRQRAMLHCLDILIRGQNHAWKVEK